MDRLRVAGGADFISANFVHCGLRDHSNGRMMVPVARTYAGNRVSLALLGRKPQFQFICGNTRNQSLIVRLLQEKRIDNPAHFAAGNFLVGLRPKAPLPLLWHSPWIGAGSGVDEL
jgi:dTDP-D-glucose 4,6-dehydratase